MSARASIRAVGVQQVSFVCGGPFELRSTSSADDSKVKSNVHVVDATDLEDIKRSSQEQNEISSERNLLRSNFQWTQLSKI